MSVYQFVIFCFVAVDLLEQGGPTYYFPEAKIFFSFGLKDQETSPSTVV